MKRTMVYVLALTLAFSTLLAGCGEMTNGKDGKTGTPTAAPQQTVVPGTVTPDPADGVVRDQDGIITDGDTGSPATGAPQSVLPESSQRPAAGTAGSGTAGATSSAKR